MRGRHGSAMAGRSGAVGRGSAAGALAGAGVGQQGRRERALGRQRPSDRSAD